MNFITYVRCGFRKHLVWPSPKIFFFFSLANNCGKIYKMLYNRIEGSNFFFSTFSANNTEKCLRFMICSHLLRYFFLQNNIYWILCFVVFYEYTLYTLHRIWHAFKAERKENRYGYEKSLSFWPLNKNNNKDKTTQIIVSDTSIYT